MGRGENKSTVRIDLNWVGQRSEETRQTQKISVFKESNNGENKSQYSDNLTMGKKSQYCEEMENC